MSFHAALAKGQKGEALLLSLVPSLVISDTRNHDLYTAKGERVEVKYDTTKHPNYFLETISNSNKKSPGGAFQSIFKKVDFFVYIFERDQSVHVFKCADLAWFMYLNKETYKIKNVWNPKYTTHGQAVPMADLEHLKLDISVLGE